MKNVFTLHVYWNYSIPNTHPSYTINITALNKEFVIESYLDLYSIQPKAYTETSFYKSVSLLKYVDHRIMARTSKLVVLSSTMCLAQCHPASRSVEETAFTGMEFHLPSSFPCASLSRSRGRLHQHWRMWSL